MFRAFWILVVTFVVAGAVAGWVEMTRATVISEAGFIPPDEDEKEADSYSGPIHFDDERLMQAARCTVYDMTVSDGLSQEWWARFHAMDGDPGLVAGIEAEARDGNVEAMELIAFHLASRGDDAEEAEAGDWMMLAAEAGSITAINEIGYSLTHGGLGLDPDIHEGAIWLRRAIEGGDPLAASNLAHLYETGQLPPPEGMTAREASLDALLLSASHCYPPSLEQVSNRLKRGRDLPRDLEIAGNIDRNLRIYRN